MSLRIASEKDIERASEELTKIAKGIKDKKIPKLSRRNINSIDKCFQCKTDIKVLENFEFKKENRHHELKVEKILLQIAERMIDKDEIELSFLALDKAKDMTSIDFAKHTKNYKEVYNSEQVVNKGEQSHPITFRIQTGRAVKYCFFPYQCRHMKDYEKKIRYHKNELRKYETIRKRALSLIKSSKEKNDG